MTLTPLLQVARKRMDIYQIFESAGLIKKIALFSGGNVREFIRILRYLVDPALQGAAKFKDALQRLFPNGHPDLDTMKRNLEMIRKAAE